MTIVGVNLMIGMPEEARDRAARLVREHGETNWVKRLRRENPDLLPEG